MTAMQGTAHGRAAGEPDPEHPRGEQDRALRHEGRRTPPRGQGGWRHRYFLDAQGRACRSESRDTHHEVIKNSAEERGGVPATAEGTEYGDHLGVLRFEFGGDSDNLCHVS